MVKIHIPPGPFTSRPQPSNFSDVDQAARELGVARAKWGALADWEAARSGWMEASCTELNPEEIQAKVRGFRVCDSIVFRGWDWGQWRDGKVACVCLGVAGWGCGHLGLRGRLKDVTAVSNLNGVLRDCKCRMSPLPHRLLCCPGTV